MNILLTNPEDNWYEAKTKTIHEGIKIEPVEPVYREGTQIVSMNWVNLEDREWDYGKHFQLHKRVDGKWLHVTDQEIGFVDIGYTLEPYATAIYDYDTSFFIKDLTPGLYRIEAPCYVAAVSGNDTHYVYGEFIVLK